MVHSAVEFTSIEVEAVGISSVGWVVPLVVQLASADVDSVEIAVSLSSDSGTISTLWDRWKLLNGTSHLEGTIGFASVV